MDKGKTSVVVAIPCLNEEATIGKVIDDFRHELPDARIIVFDNLSTDRTAMIAAEKDAELIRVKRRGKGRVLQEIFKAADSDLLILVDGDDTYPAEAVHQLLEPLLKGEADMVVGTRLERLNPQKMQVLHQIGNKMLTGLVNLCFRTRFKDMLSGYRAFNKAFLQTVPLTAPGFETETELTLRALDHGMTTREVPISYRERPANSSSKIRTLRDGYRILLTIVMLLRDHRPLTTFFMIALFTALGGLSLFLFFPDRLGQTFTLIVFFMISLILAAGFILNTINSRFLELQMLLRKKNGS